MPDKPDSKPKEPDEVPDIEFPVSEPIHVTYTEKLPPAPPDLEIHPRRPLPPLPEAKPDAEKRPERQPSD